MNGVIASYFVVCDAFVFTLVTVCEKLTLTKLVFQCSCPLWAGWRGVRFFSCLLLLLLLILFIFLLVPLFALLFLLILLNLTVIIVWANFFYPIVVLHALDLVFIISFPSRIKASRATCYRRIFLHVLLL